MARRPTREAHRHPWARDGAIMSAPRLRMTCPRCNSAAVIKRSPAETWSVRFQEWTASGAGADDDFYCDKCGENFDEPRQVELAEEREAA